MSADPSEVNNSSMMVGNRRLPTMGAYGQAVAVVVLDASALNFLVNRLPAEDGMTKDLEKLRERAKDALWSLHS